MARVRPLAVVAAALAAAAAAAALALRPAPRLLVVNETRGETFTFAVPGGGPFAVTAHHSMYDQPVTEEFVIGPDGGLVLEAVSSPSAAVREYFGLTAAGERHAVVRPMSRIVFRVAAGVPQRLTVAGEARSFRALGDPGDRLVVTATRSAPAARWLARLLASPP